jgi:hypothetical protein
MVVPLLTPGRTSLDFASVGAEEGIVTQVLASGATIIEMVDVLVGLCVCVHQLVTEQPKLELIVRGGATVSVLGTRFVTEVLATMWWKGGEKGQLSFHVGSDGDGHRREERHKEERKGKRLGLFGSHG